MNFTDLPRYLLRKNSLIDVGVPFFDFADSHDSTEKQKLIGQEPSPNHQQRPRQAQTIIAVFGIAMSMGFGSAFSQTAAVSVNNDAAKRSPDKTGHPPFRLPTGSLQDRGQHKESAVRSPIRCGVGYRDALFVDGLYGSARKEIVPFNGSNSGSL
jgi:hypothetical protein